LLCEEPGEPECKFKVVLVLCVCVVKGFCLYGLCERLWCRMLLILEDALKLEDHVDAVLGGRRLPRAGLLLLLYTGEELLLLLRKRLLKRLLRRRRLMLLPVNVLVLQLLPHSHGVHPGRSRPLLSHHKLRDPQRLFVHLLLLRVVEWLLLMLLLVSSAHESNLLLLMCILKVVWTTHDLMLLLLLLW
jgi:hypothetical protein